MKSSIGIGLIVFLLTNCNPVQLNKKQDDYYEKCRKLVLSENKKGQEYMFKIIGNEIDEITITYLGAIKTKEGKFLNFLNSTNFTGLYNDSRRANSSVYIYEDDQRLGLYHVGGTSNLPNKIEGSNLVFLYNDSSCNKTTLINFVDSIPKNIFIACTKNGGDLYNYLKGED